MYPSPYTHTSTPTCQPCWFLWNLSSQCHVRYLGWSVPACPEPAAQILPMGYMCPCHTFSKTRHRVKCFSRPFD
jgi:hypothetical protein